MSQQEQARKTHTGGNFLESSELTIAFDGTDQLRFQKAIDFYQRRSPVIFISQHYRFWEKHGFVQQSLARELVKSGVPVIWYDGAHWKKQEVIKTWDHPLLTITQLPAFPLRRFEWIEALNPFLQMRTLKKRLSQGSPLVWVQSGIDERVAESLPYIDVFSIFDDPYLHAPQGVLAHKAKLLVAQNRFAEEMFLQAWPNKTQRIYPPVAREDLEEQRRERFSLPSGFPEKRMGYIGSFFSEGFDLILFEDFIRSLPDWGFILCGRTDALGLQQMQRWKFYSNFLYLPWVPREQVGAIWQTLDLNLMLYRPTPPTHGAFPVKFLEALHYGVPSVTTCVPKTSSLEGFVPRPLLPKEIKAQAIELALHPPQDLETTYRNFLREMDPKQHLIRVAERL